MFAVLILALLAAVPTAIAEAVPSDRAAPAVRSIAQPPRPSVELAVPDTTHPGLRLPGDYLGLSFEAPTIANPVIDPRVSNLAELLRSLGSGELRFGGSTVDTQTAWSSSASPFAKSPDWAKTTLHPADLDRLARLATASGWRVVLGVNLGHYDPQSAADEAMYASSKLGSSLIGVELGNEPEAYVRYGLRPSGWNVADYASEIMAYRDAIADKAPGVAVIGPASNVPQFEEVYASTVGSLSQPLTAHVYPLSGCVTTPLTIDTMLGGGVAYTLDKYISTHVGVGIANGQSVRIGETNNIGCGGTSGVSDTYASALWGVDDLLRAGSLGAVGVNLHSGMPGVCHVGGDTPWYAPICAETSADYDKGVLSPQPEWYAMKLISSLLGTRFVPLARTTKRNVRAWATVGDDQTLRVIIDDMQPGVSDLVHLRVPGSYGQGTVTMLTGPALSSATGTAIGGATANVDGSLAPAPVVAVPDRTGDITLTVPSGSVAVLTLTQVCTVPTLRGLPKGGAVRAITNAGCTVGRVDTQRAPRGRRAQYVVSGQTLAAGRLLPLGTQVGFRLVPKKAPPKKKPVVRRR